MKKYNNISVKELGENHNGEVAYEVRDAASSIGKCLYYSNMQKYVFSPYGEVITKDEMLDIYKLLKSLKSSSSNKCGNAKLGC